MQTRTEFASYVEFEDHIVLNAKAEATARVIHIDDSGDNIVFCVEDEDGDRLDVFFAPFDHVTIVESFLDEDSDDGVVIDVEL
jgi:hypothetical protein